MLAQIHALVGFDLRASGKAQSGQTNSAGQQDAQDTQQRNLNSEADAKSREDANAGEEIEHEACTVRWRVQSQYRSAP
jgi:hypothetical protein